MGNVATIGPAHVHHLLQPCLAVDGGGQGAEYQVKGPAQSCRFHLQGLEIQRLQGQIGHPFPPGIFQAIVDHPGGKVKASDPADPPGKGHRKPPRTAADVRHMKIRLQQPLFLQIGHGAAHPRIPLLLLPPLLFPGFRPLVPLLCRMVRPVLWLGFLHGCKVCQIRLQPPQGLLLSHHLPSPLRRRSRRLFYRQANGSFFPIPVGNGSHIDLNAVDPL